MQNEFTGIQSTNTEPGLYLDLANGQFDTYSNLQHVQYQQLYLNKEHVIK